MWGKGWSETYFTIAFCSRRVWEGGRMRGWRGLEGLGWERGRSRSRWRSWIFWKEMNWYNDVCKSLWEIGRDTRVKKGWSRGKQSVPPTSSSLGRGLLCYNALCVVGEVPLIPQRLHAKLPCNLVQGSPPPPPLTRARPIENKKQLRLLKLKLACLLLAGTWF